MTDEPAAPPSPGAGKPKYKLSPEAAGWLAIILFFLLLFLMSAGGFVGNPPADFAEAQRQNEKDRQVLLGDLPGLVGATVDTPTTTLPGATTTTAAPTTTTVAAATATTTAPQQQQQQPAATTPTAQAPPPPPPPPPPTCGFGGPISISGGDVGSVGSSGGSFTASGSSVSASVSGLPVCGQHYTLIIRASHSDGGFATVTDCKLDGGNITNSGAESGQPVTVTLLLPPNQCG